MVPRGGSRTAGTHLLVSAAVGAVVGLGSALAIDVVAGALIGWIAAASTFLTWTWLGVWHVDADETAALAVREDPSRTVRDIVLLLGAAASVAAVALVVFPASQNGPARLALGIACIVVSWALVHAVYALKYARLYYSEPIGGIDFKQPEPPTYRDFIYVAFTVGMTFQVADTDIQNTTVRLTVLRQALLSFVFYAIIISVTINVIAGLSN